MATLAILFCFPQNFEGKNKKQVDFTVPEGQEYPLVSNNEGWLEGFTNSLNPNPPPPTNPYSLQWTDLT
jgi:hypothetical protein